MSSFKRCSSILLSSNIFIKVEISVTTKEFIAVMLAFIKFIVAVLLFPLFLINCITIFHFFLVFSLLFFFFSILYITIYNFAGNLVSNNSGFYVTVSCPQRHVQKKNSWEGRKEINKSEII